MEERISIAVGKADRTSGYLAIPAGGMKKTGVIVAHGAGNNMETPLVVAFCNGLAAAGYPALRFNFLYTERGRKAPDRYETLVQTWQAAAGFLRERLEGRVDSWVAAGKSMGGRIASQMVAEGLLDAGRLVFLGYPLHPAGKKESLRDAHLYRMRVPMLFFAGTRDPLCDLGKLKSVLEKVEAQWELHVIEGGDHSFKVPKALGRTEADVHEEIVRETVRWISG